MSEIVEQIWLSCVVLFCVWIHRCSRAPFATKINHFRLFLKGLGKWGCDHIQKTVWWWKVSISKERRHQKNKKTKTKQNKTKKKKKKTPQLKKQLHKSSKCKIQTLSLSLSLSLSYTHTHTHTHTHLRTHTHTHTHTHTSITPDRPLVQTHQRSAFSAGCVKRAIKVYTKQLATTRCTSECTWSAARRGLPWSLRGQAKIWSCFSVTKFGSATAQILLESGSSAKERFRFDLK